jgi:hypothetical protein
MYSDNDVQASLNRVYEKLFCLMKNTDYEPLWKINDFQNSSLLETSALISVPLQQVPYIDSIFNDFKHFFYRNIYFAWTAKPEEGFYELLALKFTSKPFSLNPNSVKSCKIKNQEYNDGEISLSYQELCITLEENYVNEWARLTLNNIGKNLAIVMDGKVLIYPRVSSEIKNGKMCITGNYENEEYLLIKSVILGGTLDCKAKIINE